MRVHRRLPLVWLVLAACAPGDDGRGVRSSITEGAPESVGMSSEALAAIAPAMSEVVDEGRTGGIVTLVARRGTIVHWDAKGWRAVDEDPLDRNDIFRIYSMTKPVTSTAIMMLVEDGLLSLDQELAELIPAFRNVQVYEENGSRPPARPITIRDLLRHTSGLTYGMFGNTPVDQMYVRTLNALSRNSGRDLAQTVDLIATLPLLSDPGTQWTYSVSTDVLGRVVEVVSGTTLADFFRTRIFDPLRMHDTGFHVEARNAGRLTGVYSRQEGALTLIDSPVDGFFTRPPDWYSGGGGLTSSPSDYLRFAQMLLNEGELDGARLLRPETVRNMRANHIDDALLPIRLGAPLVGQGFGLGFAVQIAGDQEERYWWAGVASTYFWIDPVEEIIAFAWTQYQPLGGVQIDPLLRRLVYEAITESARVPVGAG